MNNSRKRPLAAKSMAVSYGMPVPGLPMATREQVIERITTEVENLRHYESEAAKLGAEAAAAAALVSSTRGCIMGFVQLLAKGPFGDATNATSRKRRRA